MLSIYDGGHMSDDQQNDPQYKAKPIDPSVNAEDVMGDTTGLTGVTTNSGPNDPNPSDPDQNAKMPQSLPDDVATIALDRATEPDQMDVDLTQLSGASANIDSLDIDGGDEQQQTGGGVPSPIGATVDDSTKYVTTQQAAYTQDHTIGEQDAAGGSNPDPATDDVGEMRERVTGEPDDMENPQELNSAAKMDADELNSKQ